MAQENTKRLETLRVVLIGKTGAGKSSTGNTLLGRDAFRVGRGLISCTEKCQWAEEVVGGVRLQVTDTPGVCDTHRKEEEVLKEVGKSVAVAGPGPHIILMVLRGDDRFTSEEYLAYTTLKKLFGEEIKKFMVIVFVGLDTHGDTPEEQKQGLDLAIARATEPSGAEQEAASCSRGEGGLKEVLQDAELRYIGINNTASKDGKQRQAEDIVEMMKKLKRQRGHGYYRNDFTDEVHNMVVPLVSNRVQRGNMTQDQAEKETIVAIVSETESPDFFTSLLKIVSKKVIPAAREALKVSKEIYEFYKEAKEAKEAGCAVM